MPELSNSPTTNELLIEEREARRAGRFEMKRPRSRSAAGPFHFKVARPERFELPTTWFVARYSIQLSYGRVRVAILFDLRLPGTLLLRGRHAAGGPRPASRKISSWVNDSQDN